MAEIVLQCILPAQAAGGAASTTVLSAAPSTFAMATSMPWKLSVTAPSLVTGQATNFVTITFRQLRAGSVVATIGTLTLNAAGVTLPAEVEVDVPVPGSVPPAVRPILVPGDVIDVQCVQSGTGLALPAGIVAKAEIS